MKRIGFIGLGVMGAPMAANLLKAGFKVTVHNRTRGKCAPLENAGARVADSPRDVAPGADAVVLMLPDTEDVNTVLFDQDHGIATTLEAGQVVVDMSTIDPASSVEFGRTLSAREVHWLDAPVSGGQKGAVDGTLSIMVGGSPDAFDRCRPLWEALGKNILHVGPSGHGLMLKLINQVAVAESLLATTEAARLIAHSGLQADKALAALRAGTARSGMLDLYPEKMLQGDFAPGFRIRLMHKDLRLAVNMARTLGLSLPGLQLLYTCFQEAEAAGFGEDGTQGLYRFMEKHYA